MKKKREMNDTEVNIRISGDVTWGCVSACAIAPGA